MKVKIGTKVYDSKDEPVMVILSRSDQENIMNMAVNATKYCVYPHTTYWTINDYQKIKAWMADV